MADTTTKWKIQFRTTDDSDILFYEPFSICGIEFQVNENRMSTDRWFVALMDLEIPHDNFSNAIDIAYKKLVNIFTAIALLHERYLTIDVNSLMATPLSSPFRGISRSHGQVKKIVKMNADEICKIEKILALSMKNEYANSIFILLKEDNPYSGLNLYKLFELIREDCNKKEFEKLIPKTQGFTVSDFTNNLDKPHGVGLAHSRHSVSKGDISKPMTLEQCKKFLLELLNNWIDKKISELEESNS